MSVRVIYEDVAVGAAAAASVASTAAQPFSDLPELPYGTESVIVATNELNQWVLDGSRPILTTERGGFLVCQAEQSRLHLRRKPDADHHAGRHVRKLRHLPLF